MICPLPLSNSQGSGALKKEYGFSELPQMNIFIQLPNL